MGDPKKPRKKYQRPTILWQKDMIDEQKALSKEYGLKNKKEIWRTESLLKKFREQAKKLIASKTEQAKKESDALITKLVKLNLIKPNAKLEDVLVLSPKNILDRRLQTLVFKKNLAKSIKQARQFVVHGHISIGDNKINIPSYPVSIDEENKINFNKSSALFSQEHPERIKEKAKKKKEIKVEEEPETPKETKKEIKEKKKKVPEKVPTAAELAKKKNAANKK